MSKSNEIEKLIYLFSKFPGLGFRSARRIVLHLLQDPKVRLKGLVDLLTTTANKIRYCACGNIDVMDPCRICSDETRDTNVIAIVETVTELWAIERSKIFSGRYHVLGGGLSAIHGRSPSELRLDGLKNRIKTDQIKEIIIATNATLEGQTTAFYLCEELKEYNLKISRLANGIPIGGEIDYLDEGTLSAALSLRQLL